jgi:voltage-gated potassium channel
MRHSEITSSKMTSNDTTNEEQHGYAPLYRFFMLDILFNRQARPVFIYTIIMLGVGAALYHYLEGWGWLDSFYFVVITLTTIGYGDLHPTTPFTKLITIFYALNGIVILLTLFDVVRRQRVRELSGREQLQILQTPDSQE